MWDNELEMLNCTFYNSNGQRGIVSKRAEELLNEFTSREFPEIYEKYKIADCYMPWSRFFEIGLKIEER